MWNKQKDKTMKTTKSVLLIVTQTGYVESVFASFRALANSLGVTRVNAEGEYESYTETDLKAIEANGQTFIYFGQECRMCTRALNI